MHATVTTRCSADDDDDGMSFERSISVLRAATKSTAPLVLATGVIAVVHVVMRDLIRNRAKCAEAPATCCATTTTAALHYTGICFVVVGFYRARSADADADAATETTTVAVYAVPRCARCRGWMGWRDELRCDRCAARTCVPCRAAVQSDRCVQCAGVTSLRASRQRLVELRRRRVGILLFWSTVIASTVGFAWMLAAVDAMRAPSATAAVLPQVLGIEFALAVGCIALLWPWQCRRAALRCGLPMTPTPGMVCQVAGCSMMMTAVFCHDLIVAHVVSWMVAVVVYTRLCRTWAAVAAADERAGARSSACTTENP